MMRLQLLISFILFVDVFCDQNGEEKRKLNGKNKISINLIINDEAINLQLQKIQIALLICHWMNVIRWSWCILKLILI